MHFFGTPSIIAKNLNRECQIESAKKERLAVVEAFKGRQLIHVSFNGIRIFVDEIASIWILKFRPRSSFESRFCSLDCHIYVLSIPFLNVANFGPSRRIKGLEGVATSRIYKLIVNKELCWESFGKKIAAKKSFVKTDHLLF